MPATEELTEVAPRVALRTGGAGKFVSDVFSVAEFRVLICFGSGTGT